MEAVTITTEAFRWQPHPEVWLLLAGVVALGLYTTRVIAPKVAGAGTLVAPGQQAVTRRQKGFFAAGVVVLWLAADWPVHDISEEYLYSVHMVQHALLTLVVPPLFLLATPTWLARLLFEGGPVGRFFLQLSRPVVAGLAFNLAVALTHWTGIVNLSAENGPFHYSVHTVIVILAFALWMPVCGPLPERRMSLPGQMVYLFLLSIIPTVPAGWLTFAENPVYGAYDTPARLFGISVVDDQQAAGLFMKIGVGAYLWALIAVMFFRWSARHMEAERQGIQVSERDVLTWDEVRSELDALPPGPPESAGRP